MIIRLIFVFTITTISIANNTATFKDSDFGGVEGIGAVEPEVIEEEVVEVAEELKDGNFQVVTFGFEPLPIRIVALVIIEWMVECGFHMYLASVLKTYKEKIEMTLAKAFGCTD